MKERNLGILYRNAVRVSCQTSEKLMRFHGLPGDQGVLTHKRHPLRGVDIRMSLHLLIAVSRGLLMAIQILCQYQYPVSYLNSDEGLRWLEVVA